MPWTAWQFWGAWDELLIHNGLLLKCSQFHISPLTCTIGTWVALHKGHIRITKMQHSIQSSVYWPGIDAVSLNMSSNIHHAFNKILKHHYTWWQKTSPTDPWEEIATDSFTLNWKDYLLICDTFSRYPFLFEMPKKTAEATTPKFQQLFHSVWSCKGIPYRWWIAIFIKKIYTLHDTATNTTHHIIPTLPSVKWIH